MAALFDEEEEGTAPPPLPQHHHTTPVRPTLNQQVRTPGLLDDDDGDGALGPPRARSPAPAAGEVDAVTAEPLHKVKRVVVRSPDGQLTLWYNTSTLCRIAQSKGRWLQPPHFREEMRPELKLEIERREGRRVAVEAPMLRGHATVDDEIRHRGVDDARMDQHFLLSKKPVYVCPLCFAAARQKMEMEAATAVEAAKQRAEIARGTEEEDELAKEAEEMEDYVRRSASRRCPLEVLCSLDEVEELPYVVFASAVHWRKHFRGVHGTSDDEPSDCTLRSFINEHLTKHNHTHNTKGAFHRSHDTTQGYWWSHSRFNVVRYNRLRDLIEGPQPTDLGTRCALDVTVRYEGEEEPFVVASSEATSDEGTPPGGWMSQQSSTTARSSSSDAESTDGSNASAQSSSSSSGEDLIRRLERQERRRKREKALRRRAQAVEGPATPAAKRHRAEGASGLADSDSDSGSSTSVSTTSGGDSSSSGSSTTTTDKSPTSLRWPAGGVRDGRMTWHERLVQNQIEPIEIEQLGGGRNVAQHRPTELLSKTGSIMSALTTAAARQQRQPAAGFTQNTTRVAIPPEDPCCGAELEPPFPAATPKPRQPSNNTWRTEGSRASLRSTINPSQPSPPRGGDGKRDAPLGEDEDEDEGGVALLLRRTPSSKKK